MPDTLSSFLPVSCHTEVPPLRKFLPPVVNHGGRHHEKDRDERRGGGQRSSRGLRLRRSTGLGGPVEVVLRRASGEEGIAHRRGCIIYG